MLDHFDSLINIVAVKRKLPAREEHVEHHTAAPNIHLLIVGWLAVNLWGVKLWDSCFSHHLLCLCIKLTGYVKVNQLNLVVRGYDKIVRLDVSMHDALFVQEGNALQNLAHHVLHVCLPDLLPHQLCFQAFPLGQLHDDVHLTRAFIFK